jgi:membrane protease YdiL (CAAX protease family)
LNAHEKFFSKIGVNYLILGLVAVIIQIIITNIIANTNPNALSDVNLIYIISAMCNYLIPLPIFYWLMKRIESRKMKKEKVGIWTFILYIGITMTLMWIGNLIGLAITFLLGGAIQNDITNPVQQLINSTNIWFNIVIVSILAPIFEEFFFRKMLIDKTIRYGAKVSIILSALLFGLFHGNLNQFFYAFLMGGFFAYVYIKTGKIIYPIVLHAIVNFMGSVVSQVISQAMMNLQQSISTTDLTIIVAYMILFIIFIVLGIIGLSRYKKAKFNGKKTEIELEYKYTTMFMNPGMICFVAFFIFEMIRQMVM